MENRRKSGEAKENLEQAFRNMEIANVGSGIVGSSLETCPWNSGVQGRGREKGRRKKRVA